MRIWMSSEVDINGDDDSLRQFRNQIEEKLNNYLKKIDYKNVLDEWWVIIILRDDDVAEEKIRRKKTSMIEGKKLVNVSLSLKIEYDEFKNGNEKKRKELIYDVILRSIDILEQKKIKNLEVIRSFLLDCKNKES